MPERRGAWRRVRPAGLGRAHVRVREAPGRQAEKRASGAVAGAAARGWRRRRSGSRLEAGLGSGHSLAEVAPHPGDRANRIAVGPCSHDWGKGYPRPALVGLFEGRRTGRCRGRTWPRGLEWGHPSPREGEGACQGATWPTRRVTGAVLTPGIGRRAGRRRGNVPYGGVVSGVNRQVSAVPGRRGRAPGARVLGSGPFTGAMVLCVGP